MVRFPPIGDRCPGASRPYETADGMTTGYPRGRVVAMIDLDTSHRSPLQLRHHARIAWREAVLRSYSQGRIEQAVAEELIRAWPEAEPRI